MIYLRNYSETRLFHLIVICYYLFVIHLLLNYNFDGNKGGLIALDTTFSRRSRGHIAVGAMG